MDNWRRRVFNKALEKAGMRHIRIHDLRHTYATIRISEGHDIVDVSNQLGHHSEAFTLKVYNHWLPGKRKAEIDTLDDPEFTSSSAPYMHPTTDEHKKRSTENQPTY
ncbi:MAG: tyrosine-type recombinase/integrase [Deltaproteobacteria bacterium]|nr:tyrosine-type recombinase/integrase [Deltaproteobacteria bacterium]